MTRIGALTACLLCLFLSLAAADQNPNWPALQVDSTAGAPGDSELLPIGEYVNLDKYELEGGITDHYNNGEEWVWQVLPEGLVYGTYLASTKESRLSGTFVNIRGDGWVFDANLGSRVGILRLGSIAGPIPEGIQLDAEGSAQVRLDLPENIDVRSADFRGGMPLTFGAGRRRWKIGYYHISSHLGDEFLLANPGYNRLNFVRDVLVFGQMVYVTPRLRMYAEAGWAFNKDVSEPWEFQFGLDYAPLGPTGICGAPFFALNGHLREEVNFGGSFTAQAGWAWRSDYTTPLLRAGLHYYNGKSNQYSFYNEHEQQFGLAMWYDF